MSAPSLVVLEDKILVTKINFISENTNIQRHIWKGAMLPSYFFDRLSILTIMLDLHACQLLTGHQIRISRVE